MGYDNECILNIQSLPGEYFCPVCRTLVYPNEAFQSQCTHVYCKPCLAYVVATTQACPYDGYLVTEADSKPLVESSKELAEHIGKVSVHCLYHRSGCSWQGTLAESTTHCAGCSYGNSPVVCNRCGTQIVHHQVQDHAQICPGVQPQAQAVENGQVETAAVANQAVTQDPSAVASAASTVAASTSTATTAAPSTATTASAPSAIATAAATTATASSASAPVLASASGPNQVQGSAVVHPQTAAQAPTPEQWYQQQHYQQYYQQYPGYDPYQQHYQHYAQYQQQVHPQYVQPQPYIQPQHQPQPQAQAHAQSHPQPQAMQQRLPQSMPQPHPHPHVPGQVPQMQGQQPLVPAQQPYPQAQPTPHGHVAGQPFPQVQPHAHARPPPPPPPPPPPQHQYSVPPQQAQHQMLQPQPQQQPRPHHLALTHPPPQPQMQQTTMQMQPQPQPHPHPQLQLQSATQAQPPHPSPHAVSGYQSFPQPIPGASQQQSIHMHSQQQGMPPQHPQHPPQSQAQFPPQQPSQMRPPHVQMPMQVQQQPTIPPPQGPHANVVHGQQQVQHLVPQPGQQVSQQPGMQSHVPQHGFLQPQAQAHLIPGQPQQQGAVPSQHYFHPQQSLRPHGPAHIQQPIPGPPQQQFNSPSAQGLPPNQGQTRPMMVHQGRMPQSEKLPQLPHSVSQGALPSGSPATPKEGAPLPDKHHQHLQLQSELSINDAEKTEYSRKIPEHAYDLRFRGKDENDTIDVKKERDTQAENDSNNGSEPKSLAKEETVNGPMTEHVKEEGLQGEDDKLVDKFCAHEGQDFHTTMVGTAEVHPQPGSDRIVDQVLQPTQQNIHPSQERVLPQPGYHDGNPSQFPQQNSDDRRRMPPGPPPPNQERYPPQHILSGYPPNATTSGMVTQSHPASESIYPQGLQPMPQSSQERRLPGPPPYQMQVHGHAMPPNQMAPPGHNIQEDFPCQGQTSVGSEPCWPPPHAGASGPGLPPPPAMAPGMPPRHVEAARIAASERLAQPGMGGPPSGAYETPNKMMGEGPSCIPEDKVGRVAPANAMGAEAHSVRKPGVFGGRQLEPHRSIPTEHAIYGQPNINMNGTANKVPAGGIPVPEDRFNHFPEGAYDDCFKPALDPGRQMVNRREFENDLKQFPRPTHLGGEGPPTFDGYLSSSRPLQWPPQQSGGDLTSRPLPSYQQGAPNSEVHLGDRDRPVFFHENLGRNYDPTVAHPGLNLVPEYSHHSLMSPGNFNSEFRDGPGGLPSGGLPGHLRGGLDGHGPPGHGLSSDTLGSGLQNVPIHLKSGGFSNHLDMGEPGGHGNLPPHLPIGDPRFNGNFNMASLEGDVGIFEHPRKRKPGNMVLCRLCKIDCGTLEGLEHHSQTRGHLKTAMDIALSIKQEAMKHKLASEKAIQFEGANKSRKRSFESRGTRQ